MDFMWNLIGKEIMLFKLLCLKELKFSLFVCGILLGLLEFLFFVLFLGEWLSV